MQEKKNSICYQVLHLLEKAGLCMCQYTSKLLESKFQPLSIVGTLFDNIIWKTIQDQNKQNIESILGMLKVDTEMAKTIFQIGHFGC